MKKMFEAVKILLRGMSQILLQTNAWTGLFFLFAVLYNSLTLVLGTLLGLSIATSVAFLLKYPKKEIQTGMYGASGAMIGMAVFFLYGISGLSIFSIILGSAISVYISKIMLNKKIYSYTFAFTFIVWVIIAIFYFFNIHVSLGDLHNPSSVDFLTSIVAGFSQILYQENLVSGILILIGLLINSRISAIYAIMGSFFGVLFAVTFSYPMSLINIGLFSYNGVLCAIACINMRMFSLRYALISIIFSAGFMYIVISGNLIALSAPSLLAIWVTQFLKKKNII